MDDEWVPRAVAALAGKRVVSLAVGCGHMAVVTHENRVFAWGDNDDFQCGREASAQDRRLKKRYHSGVDGLYTVEELPVPGPARAVHAAGGGLSTVVVMGPFLAVAGRACMDSARSAPAPYSPPL